MAVKFLKKGKEAHKQVADADKETERKQAAGLVRRFYIPIDKENQITFLDGDLDSDDLLITVTYWEHQLYINGNWRNWFTCTQDHEPCPICIGSNSPALVAAFTVIDHSEWTDKNGLEHKNEKRLFICKRETFKRLQKLATKREGLTGITFDVSRTGDKSPSVGSDFDFVEKRSIAVIKKTYGLKAEEVVALDYEKVILYRDAAELNSLGFGIAPVGAQDAKPASETNYDKDL